MERKHQKAADYSAEQPVKAGQYKNTMNAVTTDAQQLVFLNSNFHLNVRISYFKFSLLK